MNKDTLTTRKNSSLQEIIKRVIIDEKEEEKRLFVLAKTEENSLIISIKAIQVACKERNENKGNVSVNFDRLAYQYTVEGLRRARALFKRMQEKECFKSFQLVSNKEKILFLIKSPNEKKIKSYLKSKQLDDTTSKTKPFKKKQASKDDLTFGDGFIITIRGHIYKNGEKLTSVGKSGRYLLQTLKSSNGGEGLGKDAFKPINKNAKFAWTTIKKNKNEITNTCGEVISTNKADQYYYAYSD